jgi:actin-related protein 5
VLTSGAGGRGERLNASQKERMKLLTTAAFDRGKDEDTFGLHDEDWQLYKRMSKDADDLEEADDEEAELSRLTNRLKVVLTLKLCNQASSFEAYSGCVLPDYLLILAPD